ncbi:imidazole glycerol phosphate synthase subunit HisH [Feifania hominis]|uniref:Imidazole glycerol phosphate synthase subunit HisH n=1 Tax=Feifania hominis TaxID=2763660 RepID=A0A926DFR6_9FIRM|nr:imidazole glycerol phosphate synthase subunit HisH [Feifania hominis]
MIGIVDYGAGNLMSVQKALTAVGSDSVISDRPEVLRAANSLVLPGVGAFPSAMRSLRERGLDRFLVEQAALGKPLLGICLGMQMLFTRSEELGDTQGLNLIPGVVRRIKTDLKIPHVGWNSLTRRAPCALLDNLPDGTYCYFVHSFEACVEDPRDLVAVTDYGGPVTAAVARGNVYGVQFHPEKSSAAGLAILRTFSKFT